MAVFMDLKGTSQSSFQIQKGGVKIKNSSGVLQVRNAADSAYADIVAAILKASGDTLILNSDATSGGADWAMTLARPASGMTAAVTYTLPAAPTNGYILSTDGSGVLTWVAPSTPAAANVVLSDSTTITNLDGTGPISLFTLPANAVVHKVQVIVDTTYDVPGGVSVGTSASPSKYMSNTQSDVQGDAGDVYESTPGQAPVGTTESLEANLNLASFPSAGGIRVLVFYSLPA